MNIEEWVATNVGPDFRVTADEMADALRKHGYQIVKLERIGNVHPANPAALGTGRPLDTMHWEFHSKDGLHMTDRQVFIVTDELT